MQQEISKRKTKMVQVDCVSVSPQLLAQVTHQISSLIKKESPTFKVLGNFGYTL